MYLSSVCIVCSIGALGTQDHADALEHDVEIKYQRPIIDVKNQHVYHGGNFHGDYISLEMDKLKIVITKLTMLAERQLNYLLNSIG